MASVTDEESLEWTETSYTIAQVIQLFQLPCLVRVSDGVYSANDCETFSTGDYLKLHCCQRIEHLVSYPVASDNKNTIPKGYKSGHPFLIPLDYPTKVKLPTTFQRAKRYPTVKELLNDFPKFVRVGGRPIDALELMTNSEINLPANSTIELVKTTTDIVTKAISLICRWEYKDIVLKPECFGDFSSISTESCEYTLRQIVTSFKLPQLIEFCTDIDHSSQQLIQDTHEPLIKLTRFQGRFVVDKLQVERNVVGSHRLDLHPDVNPETADSYRSHRAAVLIPLTSESEFQVAENVDSAVYQTLFSAMYPTEVNSPTLSGLYIEKLGDSGGEDESDYSYPDLRLLDIPERSPRKPSLSDDKTQILDAPVIPKRDPHSVIRKMYNTLPELPQNAYEESGYRERNNYVNTQGAVMPVPKSKPQVRIPPRINPATNNEQPVTRMHNYMDVNSKSQAVTAELKHQITAKIKHSVPNPKEKPEVKVKPFRRQTNKPPDKLSEGGSFKKENEKQSWSVRTTWQEKLKTYSVDKIGESLKKLGFGEKVTSFVNNDIDGEYLMQLIKETPKILTKEPFLLTDLDMMKLEKFAETGKLPLH